MLPLMHYRPDGRLDSTTLTEAFRFESDGAG